MLRTIYSTFDTEIYDFRDIVCNKLNTVDLDRIHEFWDYELFERSTDQSTIWHEKWYEQVTKFKYFINLYDKFVTRVIRPMIGEPLVYQITPNLRIHLPDNVAVGEFHKDSKYGHSKEEINIWIPLTVARDSSALQVDGVSCAPMDYGKMLIFDGANLEHGNKLNETGKTRVSFDFRVIPMSRYTASTKSSINTKRKFEVGGYFKELSV